MKLNIKAILLSGLCLLGMHIEVIKANKPHFIGNILNLSKPIQTTAYHDYLTIPFKFFWDHPDIFKCAGTMLICGAAAWGALKKLRDRRGDALYTKSMQVKDIIVGSWRGWLFASSLLALAQVIGGSPQK